MKRIIKEYGGYIVVILAIILVKTFLVTNVRVNGTSMDPTLEDGDIMLLNKIVYRFNDIKRYDIVVVNADNKKIIKRVIGLPNENIKYSDNKLYINGKEVEDIYNLIDQYDFDITLGNNDYFVMGDNRGVSRDSRMIGPINKSKILGEAKYVIFPFSRFGAK